MEMKEKISELPQCAMRTDTFFEGVEYACPHNQTNHLEGQQQANFDQDGQ
jgi:hypothetical protein